MSGPDKTEALRFGPVIVSEYARGRQGQPLWVAGYTQGELDHAQDKFGLVFPPDLLALFRERRPSRGWDWRTDEAEIRSMLDWPLEGLLFDVENNNLWWQEWGERPGGPAARAEVLRDIVRSAPKLVPLVSHRYLPCEPNEAGNPVFSIHQSDVVYYGSNLEDYFAREFENTPSLLVGSPKHIRFWSTLVERNG